ncbi:MAG: TetR/AcrR family transcriptional regulator [Chitinophagales bacterium]
MSQTKTRILKTALFLFNKDGYSNVTIRNIATELKMSSGNLNYHFRKREEILEALYFEMVAAFDQRIDALGQTAITIQTIKEDMQHSLERMISYRFFWTDLYNILRQNEAIRSHFEKAYLRRFQGYEQLFAYLNHQGLMKDFEFEKEASLLIEGMIGFSNTWLYNSLVYNKNGVELDAEQPTLQLISMLYPYLTNQGKAEFRKVMLGVLG